MTASPEEKYQAFLWDRGVITAIKDDTKPDILSDPWGINDLVPVPAFFWEKGKFTDLGALPGDPIGNAERINNKGQAVGWSLHDVEFAPPSGRREAQSISAIWAVVLSKTSVPAVRAHGLRPMA